MSHKLRAPRVRKLFVAPLVSLLVVAGAAGSTVQADPSPRELIAAGRYQPAADALLRVIHQTCVPGEDSSTAAVLLSNLGLVYEKLGRYAEAQSALERSIRIFRALGLTGGRNYARALNNLASVHFSRKRYAQATAMWNDVLALYRGGLKENSQDIAQVLNNLGMASISQNQPAEAERLFREALELHRKTTPNTPPNANALATALNNTALACKLQGRIPEAAGLYAQAIGLWRADAGAGRPELAVGLHNLASLEAALEQNAAAEAHFKEALAIASATLPPEHPTHTAIMAGYADLLRKLGRKRESRQLLAGARTLRARHDHQNFQDLTVDIHHLAR